MSRPDAPIPYAEVIGDPIAQSKSPTIHNYWIGQLGLNADYRKAHVTAEGLEDYLTNRRTDENWRGCNVTMPHKQAVMAHLDRLDPLAETIGAVNTIIREDDGSLTGYNTDAGGFLEPLKTALKEKHLFRMARIMGTGGAARAIIAALAGEGVVIVLSGRNTKKARALLDELAPKGEHHVAPLTHFAKPTDFEFDDRDRCFDLVVNASPLGMAGQPELAFDFSHAPPGSVVYDIVTNPIETPFLKNAREQGFEALDGLNMLIGQAAEAFERFFGAVPIRNDGDTELRALILG